MLICAEPLSQPIPTTEIRFIRARELLQIPHPIEQTDVLLEFFGDDVFGIEQEHCQRHNWKVVQLNDGLGVGAKLLVEEW